MSALIHPKTITVDGLSVRYAEGGQHGPDAILMSPCRAAHQLVGPSHRGVDRQHRKAELCFASRILDMLVSRDSLFRGILVQV
jgi:hypothetical protein